MPFESASYLSAKACKKITTLTSGAVVYSAYMAFIETNPPTCDAPFNLDVSTNYPGTIDSPYSCASATSSAISPAATTACIWHPYVAGGIGGTPYIHNLALKPNGTIALDTTTSKNGVFASTFTQSITIGVGSNRVVALSMISEKNAGGGWTVSSVKIGATNFTLAKRGVATINGQVNAETWYLVNPPSGAQTITVTMSATASNSVYASTVAAYSGVDQVTPVEVVTGLDWSKNIEYNVSTTTKDTVTVPFGAVNPYLLVGIAITKTTPLSATSVTFAGQAMTLLRSSTTGRFRLDTWGCIPTTDESADIVATWASAPTWCMIAGASFSSVDPTTPIEAFHDTINAAAAAMSDTITTLTAGAWVFNHGCQNINSVGSPKAAVAPLVQRWSFLQSGNLVGVSYFAGTQGPITPTANVTSAWTGNALGLLSSCSIKPAAAAATSCKMEPNGIIRSW